MQTNVMKIISGGFRSAKEKLENPSSDGGAAVSGWGDEGRGMKRNGQGDGASRSFQAEGRASAET